MPLLYRTAEEWTGSRGERGGMTCSKGPQVELNPGGHSPCIWGACSTDWATGRPGFYFKMQNQMGLKFMYYYYNVLFVFVFVLYVWCGLLLQTKLPFGDIKDFQSVNLLSHILRWSAVTLQWNGFVAAEIFLLISFWMQRENSTDMLSQRTFILKCDIRLDWHVLSDILTWPIIDLKWNGFVTAGGFLVISV